MGRRRTPHRKSTQRGAPVASYHHLRSKPTITMPPFKDEHILLIAPGSQMTLAQLGLPETFTPARFRFPTRMFPAEKKGEFEPYRVNERRQEIKVKNGTQAPKEDVEMKDAQPSAADAPKTESTEKPEGEGDGAQSNGEATKTVEEVFYEEDVMSDKDAIYPIENGRIVDWPCFFALLTHIYNTLSPPFHTPIMLIAEPVWSARDREAITQFVFEKFKAPAFSLMDSALAACYGYGVPTATVVDVGKGKVDVTAVTDFAVNEHGRDPPPGTPLPGDAATARQGANPAAAASTGGADSNDSAPRGPGDGTQTGTEGSNEEDEGVLDVAAIVSGNTTEYLANIEKEKTTTKKGAADPKQGRLPNSKKEKASFQFEEFVQLEGQDAAPNDSRQYIRRQREIEVSIERFLLTSPRLKNGDRLTSGILEDIATQIHHTIIAVPDATKRSELWDSLIIVGCGSKVKGFTQALLSVIQQKFILSPSGTIFTSEIPSTFTTPAPTGANTPSHMGQSGMMYHPAAPGVNPLLVAATHNNPGIPGMPGMPGTPGMDPNTVHYRSTGHSQTPTSVKTLKLPEYFPDFKDHGNSNAPGASGANSTPGSSQGGHGMEEAIFLGAQMAAKVFFVLDQGLSKGYMSRVEYNESGPSAIHEYIL
ncbi:hypothetical protein N7499_002538 [Penicillium canescens]|nr:hypothetical protein N7499_002538 [Penicillium canescens]KAJ6166153.1 hypothetical protein N7485_009397 [Penicillium canescens]